MYVWGAWGVYVHRDPMAPVSAYYFFIHLTFCGVSSPLRSIFFCVADQTQPKIRLGHNIMFGIEKCVQIVCLELLVWSFVYGWTTSNKPHTPKHLCWNLIAASHFLYQSEFYIHAIGWNSDEFALDQILDWLMDWQAASRLLEFRISFLFAVFSAVDLSRSFFVQIFSLFGWIGSWMHRFFNVIFYSFNEHRPNKMMLMSTDFLSSGLLFVVVFSTLRLEFLLSFRVFCPSTTNKQNMLKI